MGQFATGKLKVTTVPFGSRLLKRNVWVPGNSSSNRRSTLESPVPGFIVASLMPTPSSLMV
jgi:hypothetical protein